MHLPGGSLDMVRPATRRGVDEAPVEAVSGFARFLGCGIAAAAVRSSRLNTRRASSPYVARSPLSLAVWTSSRKLVYRSASTCSQGVD